SVPLPRAPFAITFLAARYAPAARTRGTLSCAAQVPPRTVRNVPRRAFQVLSKSQPFPLRCALWLQSVRSAQRNFAPRIEFPRFPQGKTDDEDADQIL